MTLKHHKKSTVAQAAWVLSALLAGQAWAADAESTAKIDPVTIVGSRAKVRTVIDSDVPVDVFSRQDIERAMASGDLGEALQALSPAINMPKVSASGTSDTVRAIQLRGLAPDQALVLVNGKRRHTNAVLDQEGLFPGTVAVDLNTIPPSAIERIEVLRDGAGALYGSDAVAGVVNIVLKKRAEGGSAYVSFGGYHTAFSPTGKTLNDGQNLQMGADAGFAFGQGGSVHVGFDLQHKNGSNRAGPAGDFSWNSTPADTARVGQVLYKSGDPDLRNTQLFYDASLPVGGGLEAYSFATYNHREAEGAAFFRWPGDPGNVPAVYPQGFRPETTNKINDGALVVGLRGDVQDWHMDASLRHGENRFEYGLKNSINASLGATSPTRFHLANFISSQTGLNVDLRRSFDNAPLPWNLALGAEVLHDHYETQPGDPASYAAGALGGAPGSQGDPGLQPQNAVNLGRTAKSIYVDVDSDITDRLLLGAALRYADYAGSGNQTTGKLSGRYKLSENFLVRSALSNSFRAPALAQIGFRNSTLDFNADQTGLVNAALLPATDALAKQFGAQPLKPETSTNFSLGFAAQLAKSTSLTVDAYQIRIKDRISRSSDLNGSAVAAYLSSIGRSDIESVAFLTNALDTTTTGVDVVVSHATTLQGGALNLSAALNLNQNHLDAVRNSSTALSAIDPSLSLFSDKTLFDLMHQSPKNKLILTADWSGGAWSLMARATRYGEFSVMSYAGPEVKYHADWGVDLEAQLKLTQRLSWSVGGNNVFNRYPDQSGPNDNLAGSLPYNYVAPIGINGAYFYTRLSLAF
ncbi:TonB-dependent receptor plug domain-containing protein [Roseateles koreensis]|uniref:TonB-dependent receptor n=1 Tax=Roseateles koreensis TaxID=2987526 RepID=A0ABT5KU37_9BURK|nr:TonB-dependent receptor [Roseateles koreensis]MDC8786452.1 TonB-dependent receptor [Roseateles koreensis]